VATVLALAWCIAMPALQGPDEVSHFAYVQKMVERHEIPWSPRDATTPKNRDPYSTEVYAALRKAEIGSLAANRGARAAWTTADEAVWRAADRKLTRADRRDGSLTSAMRNPPAYYMYDAVAYEAAKSGSFFDRIFAMRLANIPLLLATVVFVWLLAAELLPGAVWPRFIAAATAVLQPQLSNVTATVNPDVLLTAEWSAALWLMVLVCRRGPRLRLVGPLVALAALACLTHGRGLLILPPVLLAIALAVGRERGIRLLRPAVAVPALAVAYFGIVLAAAERGPGQAREFVSYVWQFYLPKLGFMDPTIGVTDYDFGEAYVNRFYGTFAQLEVTLPDTVTRVLFWATIAGLVALVATLVVRRSAVRRDRDAAIVLVTAIVGLIVGLHYVAYRAMVFEPGDPIITGRYFLPLIGLFGAAIALIATTLPRRAAAAFVGVVLAAGVCLQWTSLGLLVERFHA
jgi:4-amino-4-deoxy-L-arabinose transferase-like glycosyltransferase